MPRLLARSPVLLSMLLLALPVQAQDRYTIDDILTTPSASASALTADGRWLVVTTAALRDRLGIDNSRYGDPTYIAPSLVDVSVVDTRTGTARRIFPERRQARAFVWSPDGSQLALMLRDGDVFRPMIWKRETGRLSALMLPKGVIAVDNATPQWAEDGTKLLLPVRSEQWLKDAKQRFDREVAGPIVVMSSKDPFLSWDEIGRYGLKQSVITIDVATGKAMQVLPELMLRSVQVAGNLVRYSEDITKKTDYDVIGGSESIIKLRPIAGGPDRVLAPSSKNFSPTYSGDGMSYVFVRANRIWYATLADTTPRALTGRDSTARAPGATPAPAPDSAARAAAARERFMPVRLSHDGKSLIASNREGLWLIDVATGAREMFHASPTSDDETDAEASTSPRYSVVAWSRDANSIYLTYAARDKWERGLYRYDRTTKQMRELAKDARRYSGWRLSDDGSTLVFTLAEGTKPGEVYAADADLRNIRQLTHASDVLAGRRFGDARLIDYLDADGTKLYGVLYLPVGYQQGQKVPTVFIVYETFFDEGFNSTVALLTANGYAVMQPSVRLETGYPGESWIKGVTAAANKLIELGIADPDRLGVHGTSYGGYATNLLITQTNRFKAAINISGKVDMVQFYTDSPRLGVRNIHAPEKSQDRIGGTLWEQPEKYLEHSAIMAADRIKTPLLLMTGHEDPNVPERTSMGMFYALRRLGREVEWVSYTNGGHGMPTSTAEEVIDYHTRILGWYDKYLKKPKDAKAATN
jgi:dipeptidyl aminopeptidase/acylaminoacyl peptidase